MIPRHDGRTILSSVASSDSFVSALAHGGLSERLRVPWNNLDFVSFDAFNTKPRLNQGQLPALLDLDFRDTASVDENATQEIKNVTKPGGGGGAGIRNSPATAVTFFGSMGAINTSSSGGLSPRLKKGGGVTRFPVRPSVDGFAFFRLPRIVIPDSRLEMWEILGVLSTYLKAFMCRT